MIGKPKVFLINVLLLFPTLSAAQLSFGTIIPNVAKLVDDFKKTSTETAQSIYVGVVEKVSNSLEKINPFKSNIVPNLPFLPSASDKNSNTNLTEKTNGFQLNDMLTPNLGNILDKLSNQSRKIILEDIPESTNLDEVIKAIIYKGLVEFEENNTKYPLLDWAVEQLNIPAKFFSNRRPVTSTITNISVCNVCAAVFKYIILRSRTGIHHDTLTNVLVFVCRLFKLSSERVCRGAIDMNIDTIMYIVRQNKNLNELKMCATIFQPYSCYKSARSEWEIHIPNQDSPFHVVDTSSNATFRVLHITDIHVDPFYEEGRSTDCGEPLCCQNDQSFASKPTSAAGKWGDYSECDMPFHSFSNLLEQISKQVKQPGHEIDFVYYTGDTISHRMWNTSKKGNTEDLQKTYEMLKEYFGSIPVYSVIGNHEPHPLNVFSPPSITNEFSNRWIFDVMAEEWSQWLPNSVLETVRYGGYYSVVVRPGFRIIALNSNICYILNWWLLYDDIDPFHQLQWLSLTLKKAESNNEFVHILSHVPPGDNTCIQEWTRQFHRIVERFSHVIKGQFNGHTHYDELRVFYNSSNQDQIINVAYNGGSFTSFIDLNPNYRYYSIDSETYDVVDYEQWMYNLHEANLQPDKPPKWYKQYTFKDAYDLSYLKYKDIENLIQRMANNVSLLEQYHRFKVRDSTPSLISCKESCHKENLCSIVTTVVDEDSKCNSLTKRRGFLFFF